MRSKSLAQKRREQLRAMDPATPLEELAELAEEYPAELLQNPLLPLLAVEDPALFGRFQVAAYHAYAVRAFQRIVTNRPLSREALVRFVGLCLELVERANPEALGRRADGQSAYQAMAYALEVWGKKPTWPHKSQVEWLARDIWTKAGGMDQHPGYGCAVFILHVGGVVSENPRTAKEALWLTLVHTAELLGGGLGTPDPRALMHLLEVLEAEAAS